MMLCAWSCFGRTMTCDGQTDRHMTTAYTTLASRRAVKIVLVTWDQFRPFSSTCCAMDLHQIWYSGSFFGCAIQPTVSGDKFIGSRLRGVDYVGSNFAQFNPNPKCLSLTPNLPKFKQLLSSAWSGESGVARGRVSDRWLTLATREVGKSVLSPGKGPKGIQHSCVLFIPFYGQLVVMWMGYTLTWGRGSNRDGGPAPCASPHFYHGLIYRFSRFHENPATTRLSYSADKQMNRQTKRRWKQ